MHMTLESASPPSVPPARFCFSHSQWNSQVTFDPMWPIERSQAVSHMTADKVSSGPHVGGNISKWQISTKPGQICLHLFSQSQNVFNVHDVVAQYLNLYIPTLDFCPVDIHPFRYLLRRGFSWCVWTQMLLPWQRTVAPPPSPQKKQCWFWGSSHPHKLMKLCAHTSGLPK